MRGVNFKLPGRVFAMELVPAHSLGPTHSPRTQGPDRAFPTQVGAHLRIQIGPSRSPETLRRPSGPNLGHGEPRGEGSRASALSVPPLSRSHCPGGLSAGGAGSERREAARGERMWRVPRGALCGLWGSDRVDAALLSSGPTKALTWTAQAELPIQGLFVYVPAGVWTRVRWRGVLTHAQLSSSQLA